MNIKNPLIILELFQSKFIKTFIIFLVALVLTISFQVALAPSISANNEGVSNALCEGATLELRPSSDKEDCEIDEEEAVEKINATIRTALDIFSFAAGVASVLMLVYAGFRYTTSGGNDAGVKSAKNTMIYAVIGIVLVALARVIVQLVLSQLE